MTLKECPRCHGLRFNDITGRFDKGHPNPTMRIDNVMATTQTVHWHCGNCCYKEQTPYEEDGDAKTNSPVQNRKGVQTILKTHEENS